jgi:hypothetical protein
MVLWNRFLLYGYHFRVNGHDQGLTRRFSIRELLLAMRSTIHYVMSIQSEFEMTLYFIPNWIFIPSGCGSPKRLEQNLGAIDVKLSEKGLAACNELWQQLIPLRFFYGR